MAEDAVRPVDVVRIDRDGRAGAMDAVAAERALEVRLEGEPFAVIMRTPGDDADLAAGFLLTEGVIRGRDDVRRIEAGEIPDVVNVRLSRSRAEILPELLDRRRPLVSNASCGVCGRRSLESLGPPGPPMEPRWQVPPAVVSGFPAALRGEQDAFDRTGGLHAAGVFDRQGRLERSAEDIGRHNAVDKVIGRMLADGRLPLQDALLFVSGRVSFEIVQKACAAGIPFVAAVSAPSSLAVEVARATGITLVAFLRDGRFNIYAHEERVGV